MRYNAVSVFAKIIMASSVTGDCNGRYCREVLQKLNNFRIENSLCDVTLVVDRGNEFKAHRNVLAASSPYLKTFEVFLQHVQQR